MNRLTCATEPLCDHQDNTQHHSINGIVVVNPSGHFNTFKGRHDAAHYEFHTEMEEVAFRTLCTSMDLRLI